jgi:serine/threonine-protein phosphatase 2A regulatory subunit B'
MFAKNIFRPIPNVPHAILQFDDWEVHDTGWTHIQLVYDLFLKFLDCPLDLRILQYGLTPRFITNLYAILDFPDERERQQMKEVIASIFNKVPPHRGNLRVIAANMLMCVPENLYLTAATPLLELFHLFTMNIASPLTPLHISQFDRVLLPLHLGFRSPRYFGALTRCTMLMARKDPIIGNNLIHFLITHWPLTLDHKAELFIKEISRILEISITDCIKTHICELLGCIAISIESPCTMLAEKAVSFIQDEAIQQMISDDPLRLFKVIFPSLFRVAKNHWEPKVQLKALHTMNAMMVIDPNAFAKTAAEFREESMLQKERNSAHKTLWTAVAERAATNFELIDVTAIDRKFSAFFEPGVMRRKRRQSTRERDRKSPSDGEEESRYCLPVKPL